jgi:hypothetical protein
MSAAKLAFFIFTFPAPAMKLGVFCCRGTPPTNCLLQFADLPSYTRQFAKLLLQLDDPLPRGWQLINNYPAIFQKD